MYVYNIHIILLHVMVTSSIFPVTLNFFIMKMYKIHMMNNPCGARRKMSGALDSCFGLVSPHQQSIPFPYLQAPRVIKASSSAALVVLNMYTSP